MKNFIISYLRNNVTQAIIVKAERVETAERFFNERKPDAILFGTTEKADISEEMRKGMPIITAQ